MGTMARKTLDKKKKTITGFQARNGGLQPYDFNAGVYKASSPPDINRLNIVKGYDPTRLRLDEALDQIMGYKQLTIKR
jgi:hypothetical protein